jgi:hypothetical protein
MFNIIFAIRILGQAVDLGCATLIPQMLMEFVWPMGRFACARRPAICLDRVQVSLVILRSAWVNGGADGWG